MKSLTVYKASAGSGKTFRLAVEYIKLLIDNPMSYRTTLAVTFTNKATEEMKIRILSQLYGIWKRFDDSKQYADTVCKELGIGADLAAERAGTALRLLVHDYGRFKVQTIDAFFQTVLRNLARELELTANLRVGLNDEQVEELAVDKLIDELQPGDAVLRWVMNYVAEKMDEDKSWNIISSVKSFGKTIFKDFYKKDRASLNKIISDDKLFERYVRQLRQMREQMREQMTGYADTFLKTLADNGLSPDQLKGRQRGISSYFNKLRGDDWSDKKCVNNTLSASIESPDNWTTKTSPDRQLICSVAERHLIPLLKRAEEVRLNCWHHYVSTTLTLKHLSQLRLLGTIEQRVRALNGDANRFLLSDTQQLLADLMDKSDSPFVFEKIGSQLEHVMIDEFQDTSTVQWQNFKVLLSDAMSHGGNNLIVGDVKQSIYRWRSGDWRLLNDIEGQFPHPAGQLQIETLNTNWRSERNIIRFNNAFFSEAARLEELNEQVLSGHQAEQLSRAYADVEQLWPDSKTVNKGEVTVMLLPNKDFQDRMLEEVLHRVKTLLETNVNPSQIAILVRANRRIPLLAQYLAQHLEDIKLVSDEAFRLDSSVAVTMIVDAMHLLTHPDDNLARAQLAKGWQRRVLGNMQADDLLTAGTEQLDSLLPPDYVEQGPLLRKMPLVDLAERLYGLFGLERLDQESAYVCCFFDSISNYVREFTSNIDSFINEWNETLHKKTIQSDEVDGIRLISIHKSKGLEFDHVIIPFCDWQMEKNNTTLWCKPNVEPYNQLPIVPVDYSQRLTESIYADSYRDEHLQNTVDNLNLLYVAFTRASKSLFVIGKKKASNSRSVMIEQALPRMAELIDDSTLTGHDSDESPTLFTMGSLVSADEHSRKTTENVFSQPFKLQKVRIETFDSRVEFRQSNKSRDFIHSESDDADEQQRRTYIKTGSVLHNVLASIRTTDDIPKALQQLENDGVLSNADSDNSIERVASMLRRQLNHPKVADWFSHRWTLHNECTILQSDPVSGIVTERRPDRVMSDGNRMVVVDFKFGRERDEYKKQVIEYMQLLHQMGHQNVEGYLWYVYTNKIVEVNERL